MDMLGIHVLPDQNVLAYWVDIEFDASFFKLLIDAQWQPAFKPLPQYSMPAGGSSNEPSITNGPGDTLHLAFIGARDSQPAPPPNFLNFVNYASKAANERHWTIKQVYRNKAVVCLNPNLVITRDGCRHLFWTIDTNIDYWVDNIYYAYSFNGISWSEPIEITNYSPAPLQSPYSIKIVADSSEKLHVIWLLFNFNDYQTTYYYNYITGRENTWSDETHILNSNVGKKKCVLKIDKKDMLHLIWFEDIYEGFYNDTVTVKYATAQLKTSTVEMVSSQMNNNHPVENFSLTCYPNPFNNMTNIIYKIPSEGQITLSIYDMAGRKIKQLVSNFQQAGSYRFEFIDNNFPTGLYFLKLNFNRHILINKILLIK